MIRPDYDQKYHLGPKMLEYGRKKLNIKRFLQLVFIMTSLYEVQKLSYEQSFIEMNKKSILSRPLTKKNY